MVGFEAGFWEGGWGVECDGRGDEWFYAGVEEKGVGVVFEGDGKYFVDRFWG